MPAYVKPIVTDNLATVVTLISAMLHETAAAGLARLSVVPGIDGRTIARWCAWWLSTFADSAIAPVAMAALVPPVDIGGLPISLLDRFAGAVSPRSTSR